MYVNLRVISVGILITDALKVRDLTPFGRMRRFLEGDGIECSWALKRLGEGSGLCSRDFIGVCGGGRGGEDADLYNGCLCY